MIPLYITIEIIGYCLNACGKLVSWLDSKMIKNILNAGLIEKQELSDIHVSDFSKWMINVCKYVISKKAKIWDILKALFIWQVS